MLRNGTKLNVLPWHNFQYAEVCENAHAFVYFQMRTLTFQALYDDLTIALFQNLVGTFTSMLLWKRAIVGTLIIKKRFVMTFINFCVIYMAFVCLLKIKYMKS